MTDSLTIGERVAWYRRRRGMTQEVLAGLVGRTVDWLSRVENNRIPVDRLSVLTALAVAMDVRVGDLIAEPSLLEWTHDSGQMPVSALRAALMDYRQVTRVLDGTPTANGPAPGELQEQVTGVWDAYQKSRYGYVTSRLPSLLSAARAADQARSGTDDRRVRSLLAMTYQAAAMILTKLGETDLAWVAADRGLTSAQDCESPLVIGSLFRSVTHSLLANGRYTEAVRLTYDAADYLRPGVAKASPEYLSIFGTLFLAGAMAAARSADRGTTHAFLAEADRAAQRLGRDGNHFWTAFGPTNVAIHRVSAAMELGDIQHAIDLGSLVDATPLPTERRIRHAIELARAYSAWNRADEALAVLLDAEQEGPEQVRHHCISRQLVLGWVRQQRQRPSPQLTGLAQRLRVV